MITNALGIASLLLAMVPIGISSRRMARLHSLLEMHSTASSLVTLPAVRRAYKRYAEDLSHELMARTAVPGGSLGGPVGLLSTGALVFALIDAAAAGVRDAGGMTKRQALDYVLTDASLLGRTLLLVAAMLALYSCFEQSRLASARAKYLHAVVPGSQAFKRFVLSAKVYALLISVPLSAVPIAALFGVDAVREELTAAAGGMMPTWVLALMVFGFGFAAWFQLYVPMSTAFTDIRTVQEHRVQCIHDGMRALAPVAGACPDAFVESFLGALGEPRCNLLYPEPDAEPGEVGPPSTVTR